MGQLSERLTSHAVIGLDTAIFIYHLEAHPRYLPLNTLPRLDRRPSLPPVTLMLCEKRFPRQRHPAEGGISG